MAHPPDTTAHDERRSPGPESDLSFGERFYLREAIKGMGVVARQVETDLRSWVQELRCRGVTWSRIGGALGITRQSAWERFSGEE